MMGSLLTFTPLDPHWSTDQVYSGLAFAPGETMISITHSTGTVDAVNGDLLLASAEGTLMIDALTGAYSFALNPLGWDGVTLADDEVYNLSFAVNYLTVDENDNDVEGTTQVTIAINTHGINSTIYPTIFMGDSHADGTNVADLILGTDAVEGYTGNDGDDRIYAGGGDDTVYGGADNDVIFGEGGNDQLNGDAGDDEIHGGADHDTIDGGLGVDSIYGGDGADVIIFDADDALIDGGAGIDTLVFNTEQDMLNAEATGLAHITGVEYYEYTETLAVSFFDPSQSSVAQRTIEPTQDTTYRLIETFADGSTATTWFRSFDGNPASQEYRAADGTLIQSSVFPYNPTGLVIEARTIHVSEDANVAQISQVYENGTLRRETVTFNDGTAQHTDYDIYDLQEWYAVVQVYDNLGNLMSEDFIMTAPGSTVTTTELDIEGTQGWTSIQNTHDDTGALVETVTTMDDGSVQTTQFENGVTVLHRVTDGDDNDRSWSSRTVEWDAEGTRLSRTTIDDDGMRTVEEYDPVTGARIARTDYDDMGTQSWSARSTFWDETGTIQTGSQKVLNDGRIETVTYDPITGEIVSKVMTDAEDAHDWTSKASIYDAATGILTARTLTYDDGTSLTNTWDNGQKASQLMVDGDDDNFVWASRELLYGDDRRVFQITETMDDGDIIVTALNDGQTTDITTYDLSGNEAWHVERVFFDEFGYITGTAYFNEAGDDLLL